MPSKNLALRAGRWSAAHRKIAIFGWLAFVVVAFVLGGAIGTKKLKSSDAGSGETHRAEQMLKKADVGQRAGESVLVQSRTGAPVTDAFVRAGVQDVVKRLGAQPNVLNLKSPVTHDDQISKDGRSALVQFDVAGDSDHADKKVGAMLSQVAAAQKAHPGLRIEEFGDASANKALSKSFNDDFAKAEVLSLPITLLILLVAFGALVAAGLPLLLGISAVMATLGLVAIPSQIVPADSALQSVILLVGLAVGVDYSLFYLRREREERAAGKGPEAALEAAAATSGRTVLVSGLTVMIAMAGMFFAGDTTFSGMAIGTIMVVAISMLGSVSVLPALLSKLGDRVDKGRVPFLHRLKQRRAGATDGLWSAVLDRVLRRPAISAAVAGALLVALAIPAFSLHTVVPGTESIPHTLPIMRTYDRMLAAFPGGPQPAQVVVRATDVTTPAVQREIAQLRTQALATGQMKEPIQQTISRDHTIALVSIPLVGKGTDARSNAALQTLRGDLIPATVGKVGTVATTGMTAGSKDFNDRMKARAPIVFAFVLSLAFLLLLVTFRSIVIPIKAIVLNLLSVGAAYGVLVLVFQHKWAESLLGFKSIGGITAWLPLFLFVILFGLSMDYHVLILSRIREAYDRGMNTEDAVAHGIKSTAGVVTSAAVVMVAVFAIFASLRMLEIKQMGVGLAVAVLIDATLVRAVLLPATMKLLGDWNWYLPKRLHWLPRVAGHRPATETA
jgi:uncharacterized membrane protein YdfJ with MMPL/SSD domain